MDATQAGSHPSEPRPERTTPADSAGRAAKSERDARIPTAREGAPGGESATAVLDPAGEARDRANGPPDPSAAARHPGHGSAEPGDGRDPLDFEIDDAVIRRLTGRDATRLRRLTPIRAPRRDSLDAEVRTVLDALDERYRAREQKEDARRILAQRYLNAVETVTRRLNAQSLPKTTRLLLAVDGLYETLLLRAIREGVGSVAGDDAEHDHHEPGVGDASWRAADRDR